MSITIVGYLPPCQLWLALRADFPILPASWFASDMPAGTGPYKYDGYEQGSAIWLTANDG